MADLPVVNAIKELNESNVDNRQRLQKSLRSGLLNVVHAVEGLHLMMQNQFARAYDLQQQALDADELARQRAYEAQLEESRKSKDEPEVKVEGKEKEDGLGLLGIGAIIATVAAGLAAAVVGFGAELAKTINSIFFNKNSKFIQGLNRGYVFLTEGVSKYFDDLSKSIKRDFNLARRDSMKKFRDFIRPIDRFFARFAQSNLGKILNNLTVKPIKDSFVMMKNLIEQIKSFAGVADEVAKGGSTVSRFLGAFRSVFGNLQPIVKMMGTVGRIIGRLFVPITFFMGVWETVSGFFEGFQETQGDFVDKVIGGLEGAVDGLINFFIAEPLNLLKDVTAWLLGKLGFDESAEALSSFDFMRDVFDPLTDRIFGVVKGVKDFLVGLFTWDVELMGDGAETINNFILDILGAPYNMLAEAIGWIAEKFGFDNIATMMEDFDFGTLIKDMIAMPYNALKGVGSKIAGFFGFGDDDEEEEEEKSLRNRVKENQESMRSLDQIDKELRDANKERLRALKYGDEQGYQDAISKQEQLMNERRAIRGAEIDVRSREVGAAGSSPNVTVSAPQTNVSTDNSSVSNRTSVAPASARRDRRSPQSRDVYSDPAVMVF